uniref:Uncharacterized protein n=1 Tax=Grammatophora oceanica TaxID=210454 RepID=A0A6U5M950_9STRA
MRSNGSSSSCSFEHSVWECHSLFYTVCQGAFYMMCFRGKDAMEYYHNAVEYWEQRRDTKDDDEEEEAPYLELPHIDLNRQRWTALVSDPTLTPLRFCLSSVREEFLHVARVFGLVDDALIDNLLADTMESPSSSSSATPSRGNATTKPIRRRVKRRVASTVAVPSVVGIQTAGKASKAANKKKRRDSAGGIGGLGKNASNPLDSFFPFDPYLLRKSYPHVERYYRHWEGSIDIDDDSEGFDDAMEEDVEEEATSSPHGVDDVVADHTSALDMGDEGVLEEQEEKKKDDDEEEEHDDDDTVESQVTADDASTVVGNLGVVKAWSANNVTVVSHRPRGFSIESGGSW